MAGRPLSSLMGLPPGVLLRKIAVRAGRCARKFKGRLRGHLGVTNRGFRRAVRPEFRGPGGLYFYRREKGQGPMFFFDPSARRELSRRARRLFPGWERQVLASAADILVHRFDLLGSGKKALGTDIDWHMDFKSGFRWEPIWHADVPAIDLTRTGVDVKIPWELSRFQHLATLGQAYWYSLESGRPGEAERFAGEFISEITDWIEKNPPGMGVNWSCTMDVAIRVVNWLWGYYFFCLSPSLSDDFRNVFFMSLLNHARHIRGNLEYSEDLTGNHYLADIVGLVFLAVLVPEFTEAEEWRTFGARELEGEMQKQVYSDGMDFEASIPYHRLALEFFAAAYLLLKLNGTDLSPAFRERLMKMFECVLYYTRPDGLAPQIGDADDGRLQILSDYPRWERRDHRCLLTLGGHLFDREDMKAGGKGREKEVFYLLNGNVTPYAGSLPILESRAFSDSGLYLMRTGDAFAAVDCGHNGQRGRGGHAHNDTLSLELYAGEPFIIDPGAYIYTASEKWRNTFRSTSFHNTITVNGEEMNRIIPGELFRLTEDAVPRVIRWESTSEGDFLEAEHDGYARLSSPIFHRRQVYFNKAKGFWIVRDLLHHGDGSSPSVPIPFIFDQFFHFDPAVRVGKSKAPISSRRIRSLAGMMEGISGEKSPTVRPGVCVKARGKARSLYIISLATKGTIMDIDQGWVSPRYGIKKRAPVVTYRKESPCPCEFMMFFLPV